MAAQALGIAGQRVDDAATDDETNAAEPPADETDASVRDADVTDTRGRAPWRGR